MESGYEDFLESSPTRVFELSGEPAIVINGLPPLSSTASNFIPSAVTDAQSQIPAGFGEWFLGREVRKLSGEQIFNGKVTQFDEGMGWYRVVYEDGDSEELKWHEVEKLLVPLDVNAPLRSLALKIIKRRQKTVQKSAKRKVRTGTSGAYSSEGKEKKM